MNFFHFHLRYLLNLCCVWHRCTFLLCSYLRSISCDSILLPTTMYCKIFSVGKLISLFIPKFESWWFSGYLDCQYCSIYLHHCMMIVLKKSMTHYCKFPNWSKSANECPYLALLIKVFVGSFRRFCVNYKRKTNIQRKINHFHYFEFQHLPPPDRSRDIVQKVVVGIDQQYFNDHCGIFDRQTGITFCHIFTHSWRPSFSPQKF